MDSGRNPLRWDCASAGCFNVERRPKIEVFADCFPRKINFGDVDGLVELNGRFCLLEWKGPGGSLRRGQVMSFEAFSASPGNIVVVVNGDAKTMSVTGYSVFWRGKQLPAVPADLDALKARISGWVSWVTGVRAAA